jgi:hypothetical protein
MRTDLAQMNRFISRIKSRYRNWCQAHPWPFQANAQKMRSCNLRRTPLGSLVRAFRTKRMHFSVLKRFILWQNSGAQKEMLLSNAESLRISFLRKGQGATYGS